MKLGFSHPHFFPPLRRDFGLRLMSNPSSQDLPHLSKLRLANPCSVPLSKGRYDTLYGFLFSTQPPEMPMNMVILGLRFAGQLSRYDCYRAVIVIASAKRLDHGVFEPDPIPKNRLNSCIGSGKSTMQC